MPAPESSLFERSVAVRALGAHRYAAHVEPVWNGPVSPNGGVLAATMLRAAQAELGEGAPPPRTVSAHFLEAPAAGPVELSAEVLRPGRRVAFTEVRMHQEGRLVAQATLTHSAARPQPLTLTRAAPAMPPLDPAKRAPEEPMRGAPPIFRQVDVQPVIGGVPFSGGERAEVGGWIAIRGDEAPVDPARLCAACDLWWPAVFSALEDFAGVPTLQLTVHLRRLEPPASWPLFARFRTRHIAEGHLEEQGELFSSAGELLAESTQLALLLPLPRA